MDLFKHILKQYLLEISDSAKTRVRDRWKKENNNLTDEVMNFYISMFEKYSSSPNFPKKDIFQYTFKDLEKIVDANYSKETSKATQDDKVDFKGSEDVVYNDNGLLVLKGDLKEKCVKYGKGYSWCISRSDSSNMFTAYRYRMNEPAFYFVFDEDKPDTDNWHAIVIYVDADAVYNVATSDNSGDEVMSWGEIESKQPKLKGLKNLFKHVPLSKEEKDFYKKHIDNDHAEYDWDSMSFDEKDRFISIFPKKVTTKMLKTAPKQLLSKYAVTTGGESLDKELYEKLPNSDKRKVMDNAAKLSGSTIPLKQKLGIELTQEDLHVKGNLELGKDMDKLPEGLVVEGDLYVGDNIGYLPQDIEIKGRLITSRLGFLTIKSTQLKVGALVTGRDSAVYFPNNFTLKGDLFANYSILDDIKGSTTIGGNVTLYRETLSSFSKDFKSEVKWPSNLTIKGDLNLSEVKYVDKLPKSLKVGGVIKLGSGKLSKVYGKSEITQEDMLSKPETLSESADLFTQTLQRVLK